MSDQIMPGDAQTRQQAVDVTRSCIVQAPAGSGKTSLLVLRYLSLLETVDAPEEVVAITFTRKAAAEMRERITSALADAEALSPDASPYQQQLQSIAERVRQRDHACAWGLRDSPARMRIQTIDSLCHRLAGMSPSLSGLSRGCALEDDAAPLYRQAALRTLHWLERDNEPARCALEHVLLHFDNRVPLLVELLVQMLAQRHPWQRALADEHSPLFQRDAVERAFCAFTEHKLRTLQAALSAETAATAASLARYAAGNLSEKPDHALHAIHSVNGAPQAVAADVPAWQALAALLLTGSGSQVAWRKPGGVNVNLGFPKPGAQSDPESSVRQDAKAAMAALLQELAAREEAGDLAAALAEVNSLPVGGFSDGDWQTIQAFIAVLLIAEQELLSVFADRDTLDHAEVMSAALRALGPVDEPTDLALSMDYRIRHLLVDEFQDTSVTQVELLRRMVAGWQPGDGRTLFLVGDPMQSIYAFREAEVGLFLQVQQQGIELLRPEPMQLSWNFRSCTQVVNWLNRAFPEVLPVAEDALLGAVAYRPATAAHGEVEGGGVSIHAFLDEAGREADTVVQIVRDALCARPAGSVGILVRSRTHFAEIVPALRDAGIRFQAVRAEPLAARQCVQDLLSLTRALIHDGDRIAWLAVLRAPWCGMELADLLQICGADLRALVCERLSDPSVLDALSQRARRVMERVWPVLCVARAERLRKPMRVWVEGTWLALGGAACLRDDSELADAQAFFNWLEQQPAGVLPDPAALEAGLDELYARPDPAGDERVQLMTLHNAKGLEFDTVILPGLERSTRGGDAPLLRWREMPGDEGERSPLLVAPLRAAGADHAPHYQLLQQLEAVRDRNETARLAYVGATRAKTALHLLGRVSVRTDNQGEQHLRPPAAATLLGVFWPAVRENFERALANRDLAIESPADTVSAGTLHRLPVDWQCPAPPDGVPMLTTQSQPPVAVQPEFEWVGQGARYTGVVIHGLLEHADALFMDEAELHVRVQRLLRAHGVPPGSWQATQEHAAEALRNMRKDDRAVWLYSSRHQQVQTEYALTLQEDGAQRNCVIDRTFVDEDGMRWIVDFKTGTHAGGDLETFLDEEQARYRAQLELYGRCLSRLEKRPCRLALYFPRCPGWREWAYAGGP